jgi:hypothetical protein
VDPEAAVRVPALLRSRVVAAVQGVAVDPEVAAVQGVAVDPEAAAVQGVAADPVVVAVQEVAVDPVAVVRVAVGPVLVHHSRPVREQ